MMRVAVVSSEPLFRDGLVALLQSIPGFQVAGVEGPIRNAIRIANLPPDSTMVVDLRDVPERDLDFLEGIQVLGSLRTIMISDDESALTGGLNDVISRKAAGEDLLRLFISKTAGGAVERNKLTKQVVGDRRRGRPRGVTNSVPLAARQYEIARLVAQGYPNAKIAEIINLKEQTVKNVVTTIMARLGCRKRTEIGSRLTPIA